MKIINQEKSMNNVEELKWNTFKAYITNMQGGGCYEPYRIYHVKGTNKFLEMCVDSDHEIVWYSTYTIDELIKDWENDILNDYRADFINRETVTKMGVIIP